MSEQDNLLHADGKTEEQPNETPQNEEQQVIDDSQKDENKPVTDQSENTENQEHHEEAINEIEASNAEDAEDEGTSERHEIEVKDYHSMSLDDLVIELRKLVK